MDYLEGTRIVTSLAALAYIVGVGALLLSFFPMSPMTLKLWMPPRAVMIFAYRFRRLLWAVGGASLALVSVAALLGALPLAWLFVALATGAFAFAFWWGAYVPVVMRYPDRVRTLSSADADQLLRPEEEVLGLEIGGEARAYPRAAITRPHLHYDTVGGTPVTVTYCILCNSGIAFRSELDGRPLRLRPITAFNNNIIFYDRERGNFIQQLEGAVIAGPDFGKRLSAIPVVLTSWSSWKRLHPETTVLVVEETKLRDRIMSWMLRWMIPLPRLMQRRKPWHPLSVARDDRLRAMDPVVAFELGGTRRAYSLATLRARRVINDVAEDLPVVAFYDPALDAGCVFSRRLGGQTLSFAAVADPSGSAVASDDETGTTWDVMGRARSGRLAGQALRPIPHFGKIFWFSWAAFRPDTEVGEGLARSRQSPVGS